jgi:hypothetical protein
MLRDENNQKPKYSVLSPTVHLIVRLMENSFYADVYLQFLEAVIRCRYGFIQVLSSI